MNRELFKKYRDIYTQSFIPIFVNDEYDTEILLEGCKMANVKAIEYTLRRKDADCVMHRLKKMLPNCMVLSGSNLDSEKVIQNMKRLYPQLMTMRETADSVDGFVSMLPFTKETLHMYADTHIMIPSASTVGEGLRQVHGGAAFIKMSGADLSAVKMAKSGPTFGYCPIFVTGGVTVERMAEVYQAGACMTASGFDLILHGLEPKKLTADAVAERITRYISASQSARLSVYPQLANIEKLSDTDFMEILPHYHPFS